MLTNNRYRDDYFLSTKDRSEFYAELHAIQNDSQWLDEIPGYDLRIKSIQPAEVLPFENLTGIRQEVLMDTACDEGTQLLLSIGDDIHCLRNTGESGLFQTAVGLSGGGLKRLKRESSQKFCECINEFLACQSKELKLYRSCEKISGMFSRNYHEMEILDLVHAAEDSFYEKMGNPIFVTGEISHSLSGCSWEFPDVEDEMLNKYFNAVGSKSKFYGVNYVPMVRLSSSSTGDAAAVMMPMFCQPGKEPFSIGKGIRIRHDQRMSAGATGCGLTSFKNQAGMMFNLFQESFITMDQMSDFVIRNPKNAFIAACNWCFGSALPRTQAANALEEFLMLIDGNPCTMYDIYIGISEINYLAAKDNLGFNRRIDICENIGKLFHNRDWRKFDIAGTVAWNHVKGGAL